jgi:transposase
MARPSARSPEQKFRVVLAVVRGEISISAVARREGVSETTIAKWRDRFLDAGRHGLAQGSRTGPSTVEAALTAENEELKTALGEAFAELRVLRKGGPIGSRSGSWR